MAPQRVDYHWVRNELLPFLTALFDPEESNASKTTEQYWEDEVRRAESRINTIRNYDDSIITIDRIRLALAKSPHLAVADRAQAEFVIKDQDLWLTLFVRHAITQGPYPVMSLGIDPSPEALRDREILRQKDKPLPAICKSLTNRRKAYASANPGSGRESSFVASGFELLSRDPSIYPWFYVPTSNRFGSPLSAGVYSYVYAPENLSSHNHTPYANGRGDLQINQYVMQPHQLCLAVDDYGSHYGPKKQSAQGQDQDQDLDSKPVCLSVLRGDAPRFVPGAVQHGVLAMGNADL